MVYGSLHLFAIFTMACQCITYIICAFIIYYHLGMPLRLHPSHLSFTLLTHPIDSFIIWVIYDRKEATQMTQYIYSRTSTTEQNIKAQSNLLTKSYPEATLIEEQSSAISMRRPALDSLLDKLLLGDTVIVYDMSRLNRNTQDFLTLLEKFNSEGINLIIHSMGGQTIDTNSPIGKMLLTVMASIEQMNIELMKEKQAAGIADAKAKGVYKGRPKSEKTTKACEKAVELLNKGLSKEDAARAAKVGVATLYRFLKDKAA